MPTISIFFGIVVQMCRRDHPPAQLLHVTQYAYHQGHEGVFAIGEAATFPHPSRSPEGGQMVEPLRDPAMFRRAFVSFGVPSWPNGFDLDAINLHMEMQAAGALKRVAAA